MWPAKQSYLNDPDPQEMEGQQKKDISRKTCAFGFDHFYIYFAISKTPYSPEHAMSESFCYNFV